jgi:hypothetical protein
MLFILASQGDAAQREKVKGRVLWSEHARTVEEKTQPLSKK